MMSDPNTTDSDQETVRCEGCFHDLPVSSSTTREKPVQFCSVCEGLRFFNDLAPGKPNPVEDLQAMAERFKEFGKFIEDIEYWAEEMEKQFIDYRRELIAMHKAHGPCKGEHVFMGDDTEMCVLKGCDL